MKVGAFGQLDDETPDPTYLVPPEERLDVDPADETDTGDHDLNDDVLMEMVRTEGVA